MAEEGQAEANDQANANAIRHPGHCNSYRFDPDCSDPDRCDPGRFDQAAVTQATVT